MFYLPWHDDILQSAALTAATLVIGGRGAGAGDFALRLAMRFSGSDDVETDPDIFCIQRNDDENVISVAAVREAFDFFALAPVRGNCRVIVLLEAERLNLHGVNCLLKTLEEPQKNRYLILSAATAQQLPATVVSRCHLVNLPMPSEEMARKWLAEQSPGSEAILAYCGGLPLAVLHTPGDWPMRLTGIFSRGENLDVLAAAAEFGKHPPEKWLEGLQKWVSDGVRVGCGARAKYFPAATEVLREIIGTHILRWLNFQRWLCDRRALASHPLAKDLFNKEILDAYRRLCAY